MGKGSRGRNNNNKNSSKNNTAVINKTTVSRRKELRMAYKPKLILTDKILEQIKYLHDKVKYGTEWSAILVYSTKSGSIDTVKDTPWEILVEELILMDIGNSVYTEYDMEADDDYATPKWMDALESGKKLGHLHTHHHMNCYFSGTDTDELHENAPNHNYYLSLIVNYENIDKWCAKVAVIGEEKTVAKMETTTTWKGASGADQSVKTPTEELEEITPLLFTMECTIEPENIQEENSPEGLADRIETILTEKKKYPTTTQPNKTTKNSTGTGLGTGSTTRTPGYAGSGKSQSHLAHNKPYSAPGRGPNDVDDDEWTGTILDLQGNPMNHREDSKSERKGIIERYAPDNIKNILVKLLDKDFDSKKDLETVCMELELFTPTSLDAYFVPIEKTWIEDLSKFFKEELTAIHLHAITCSMYDLMQRYSTFICMDMIDDILVEHLAYEGDFNPLVIQQMTGLIPSEQMCLTIEE